MPWEFLSFFLFLFCVGFSLPILFWYYLVVKTFTSKDCYSLMTDPIMISAVPPLPSTTPDGCCCYLAGAQVGLKGIARVMSLSASLAFGVRVGLKGLATIMPLSMPFALVLIPLYAAHLLTFAQDIEDRVIYDSFRIIYGLIS